jgi:hypothetical protein
VFLASWILWVGVKSADCVKKKTRPQVFFGKGLMAFDGFFGKDSLLLRKISPEGSLIWRRLLLGFEVGVLCNR